MHPQIALRRRRTSAGLAAAVATMLALAGCAVQPAPSPSSVPPSPATSPNSEVAPGLPITLDPAVIPGLDSSVDETLQAGDYYYISLPKVPGQEAWTKALRDELTPQLDRFTASTPGTAKAPYPEFDANWDLVASSPKVVGVRLSTDEYGVNGAFAGKVEYAWLDLAGGVIRPSSDLIAADQTAEFFSRVRTAAAEESSIDAELIRTQIAGDWKGGLNAVGFTTTGRLWVEFDRTKATQAHGSVGVAIRSDGLLSEFGQAARTAALTPTDPSTGQSAPTTAASTPVPSATSAPASPSPSIPKPTATKSTSAKPTATPTPSDTPNCRKLKCVALTFDDGPVAGTATLLDVLKSKGVHATFFVVGKNAAVNRSLIRRMVNEGHVVGNHTWSHKQLTRLTDSGIRAEITKASDAIVKGGAPTPTLLRPPYGATNATVSKVAASLGMAQIMWNVDPLDWKDRNSAKVTQRVLAATRPGSIVLSHDIHPTTRAAYAAIIDGLRAKGYTLVTVPQLLGTITPGKKYFRR
ncbi:MAG: polysaccharide deacetylase family protein [Propionibacteriales bacterium]|nr:polysaccharide deacetylase family protein [Propionibacteriales bacterium]